MRSTRGPLRTAHRTALVAVTICAAMSCGWMTSQRHVRSVREALECGSGSARRFSPRCAAEARCPCSAATSMPAIAAYCHGTRGSISAGRESNCVGPMEPQTVTGTGQFHLYGPPASRRVSLALACPCRCSRSDCGPVPADLACRVERDASAPRVPRRCISKTQSRTPRNHAVSRVGPQFRATALPCSGRATPCNCSVQLRATALDTVRARSDTTNRKPIGYTQQVPSSLPRIRRRLSRSPR